MVALLGFLCSTITLLPLINQNIEELWCHRKNNGWVAYPKACKIENSKLDALDFIGGTCFKCHYPVLISFISNTLKLWSLNIPSNIQIEYDNCNTISNNFSIREYSLRKRWWTVEDKRIAREGCKCIRFNCIYGRQAQS